MTDPGDALKVGVWRAVGEYKLKDLAWPEGFFAVLIGGGGAVAVISVSMVGERASVARDLLVLAGAFLAVVFAALAVLISLSSNALLKMLRETPGGGIKVFLNPFLFGVGTQIAIVLLSIAYRFGAAHVNRWVEHVGFCLLGFLFVFALLDMAALARLLVRQGILRAELVDDNDEEDEPGQKVAKLPSRTGS